MEISNKDMKFSVEIDSFDREVWENCAQEFADYSIYQTWPYQDNRGEMSSQQVSRAIVRDSSGNVCLMCQVRIKNVRLLGMRIGYVQWGPLFVRNDGLDVCVQDAIAELKNAYLGSKVDVLRFTPNVAEGETGNRFVSMLKSCGFEYVKSVEPYRTLKVKCDDDEDGIRKRLRKSFRRDLKKAENSGVEIEVGVNGECFDLLEEFYSESLKRKGFSGVDIAQFIGSQKDLSQGEKMKVIVVYYEGKPASALLSTNLGDSGIVLLAASNDLGLECGSSYVVWYRAVVSAMEDGMKWCDLGGIDPDGNASVYRFKSRIGGEEVCHVGCYEACSSSIKRLTWQALEKVYRVIKK